MRMLPLFLLLAGHLWGSSDPLIARLADPLEKGRKFELSLGLREYQREFWLDDQMRPSHLAESDGYSRGVKGFRFEFEALWQLNSRSVLELSFPYYFQEYSYLRLGYTPPAALDDASVKRGDGMGDIRLGWVFTWLRSAHVTGGLNVELSAPTGIGPYQASSPLVARGQGSFGAAPALELSARLANWEAWGQLRGLWDLGASVDLGPTPLYVQRDPGLVWNAGLRWVWIQDAAICHSLDLELSRHKGGALRIDGKTQADSSMDSLDLVPQARFTFASGLTVVLGWQLPLWLATNQAVAYYGEPMFRADFPL